ncbi:tandem-95 repeat protein [Stieleria varia]|uniref:GEVED domain-containing protein n=1 Tax=Stieleria varia TaxID=2528005 RepID=A0A5C6B3J4_9BACT|nr:tandem-95 repeat protein [Stieleria varia]TWU06031.1 hypothetical protein Pla52n_17490 [Stieleria varia]
MTVRRNLTRKSTRQSSRRSQHQTLERRELLAAELGILSDAPRLISVSANSGEVFDLEDNNVLSTPPTELKFRFGGSLIDGATLAGIEFRRPGDNGIFEDSDDPASDDIIVQPGFLGFEDNDGTNIIVARFAETLPDDQYVVRLAGYDDTNSQIVGLRNVDRDLFHPLNPADPMSPIQDVRFEVEVGPKVVSVVPQPIEVVNGNRVQRRDQVFVFFNDDPLSNPLAPPISTSNSNLPVVRPQYYKLIYTNDTVENTDDSVLTPINVEYDPVLNRARLTFPADLAELGPAAANNNSGTYRLRIGSGDVLPSPPQLRASGGGSGDTFAQALPLGVTFGSGTQSVVVTEGLIQSTDAVIPPWPGAYDATGLRNNIRDTEQNGLADTTVGINVFPYNFARIYGSDPQGNRLENAITEAQKQRVREVLDLYSERLGVEFIETQDKGLQIVTGDVRSIVISADTGAGADTPLSIYRVNERDQTQGVLVLDAGENFFDGYGLSPDSRPSYFVEAIRGIGDLLGIGDLFHLPAGVGAGGSSPDEANSVVYSDQFLPNLPVEPEFLSQSDITIGQGLHRPESNDVDFYSFTTTEAGVVSIETIAERLDGSSLLDTHLQLYRVIDAAADQYELIARNDDFYSEDSFIGLEITAGNYIVGVSASGNDNYNGLISKSGLGGVSEGRYELRMTFNAADGSTITDSNGTALDGDADGEAGGNFNFWFRVARDLSTAQVGQPKTIFVDKFGDDLNDGSLGAPKRTVQAALALAQSGDIVRLLPNAGSDGLLSTNADNIAYEIGIGGPSNGPLADGAEFEVPQGVAVMIDAGAILKLQKAKISVGSESVDEDRSLASLQVLGTPVIVNTNGSTGSGEVYFTSYQDQSIGFDTNPLSTVPGPGQWAGIEFRNDYDYAEGRPVWEREGIFLDFVSHANMQYGGGSIGVNEPVVTPLQMAESRPTLIYNTIRNSADAAISADPNSFRETNFHAPLFQRVSRFTSDYDRVGPEIAGNRLTGNSINGLFVRVVTPAGGQLEPMTVSGRFDDTDVVHVLSQVLVLQGQPGGAVLLEDRPDVLSVTTTPTSGGTLPAAQTFYYRVTYVTELGVETLASLPTSGGTTSAGGALRLNNLPTAPNEFAGRRIYRSTSPTGNYEFVTQLDRRTTSYLDDGTTRGGLLRAEQRPDVTAVSLTDGLGGVLASGQSYDYRMTFVGTAGGQSQASATTTTFIAPDSGAIQLDNLPVAPDGYTGRRLYRLVPSTGEYQFVVELDATTTSYLDDGRSEFSNDPILDNNGNNGALFMPRYDARLSIDPGLIIKMQSARIDATFGADLFAEGSDGNEIIFTSRRDDTYGAGGTFDTNNDNIRDNAAPGDWGGLIFGQDSSGSLDFTEVRFGGGSTAVNGAFNEFNAIEIIQADVRIANSTIRDNADGSGGPGIRGGHGFNEPAAIFVRGSQPIIVENTIEGNAGAAISINPDSFTPDAILDHGRSTGAISIVETDLDNQGPLISGNRLNRNTFNAISVRSEVLTTDSIWDDTDIVHYVAGDIASATHHYRGGLRLESAPDQSLVVKFGSGAELLGTGTPLDINDRIGGTVQVIGTPGNPVVLTSINDCTVGAGFTPEGRPMNDTLNSGACGVIDVVPTDVPYVDVVVVMDESISMGSIQQFSSQFILDLEAGLLAAGVGVGAAGGNQYGAVGFGSSSFTPADTLGRSIMVGGGLFGTAADYAAATSQFVTVGFQEDGYAGINFTLDNYNFRPDAAKFIILATDEPRSVVDANQTLGATIARLQSEGIFLQGILDVQVSNDAGTGGLAIDNDDVYLLNAPGFTVEPGGQVTGGRSVTDYLPLVQATGGVTGDLRQIGRSPQIADIFGDVLISSIVSQAGGGQQGGTGSPGDWEGIVLDTYINDRNVAYVLESEQANPAAGAANATARNSQVIGSLAEHEYAGDETQRLGFNVRGTLSSPQDQDVYSFTARGGTAIYIDIDETSVGLDTVVELVDVNDVVKARSDNSFYEATNPGLLVSTLPPGTVQPLYQLGLGNVESPNPLDAGMRVILDGSSVDENQYYIRVRTANGKSAGQYQLSVRLREADEVAGATVQLADIRFATNAITVNSAPLHSPLVGDANESLNFTTVIDATPNNPQSGDEFVQEAANNRLNWTPATADQLGNLMTTDRGSLVVTGNIGNINSIDADVRLEDVDVYQIDLFSQQIEPDVFDNERRFVTTTFDIDYADGLGRPNTSIAVYDSGGRLVLHSRDSNVADDNGRPLQGVDTANLTGGSAGALDAYIGPVEMPEGTYFVVVGNAATVPTDLGQFFNPNAANTNVRLMPINSVRRIIDDSLDDYTIGSLLPGQSVSLDDVLNYTAERPIIEPAFDSESIVPYTLDDMRLFVTLDTGISGNNNTTLTSFNPFTGTMERLIGQSTLPTNDVATRIDGKLYSFGLSPTNVAASNGNTGNLLNLSTATGIARNEGDDGVDFQSTNQNGNDMAADGNAQLLINGVAFPLADGVNVTQTQPLAATSQGFIIGTRDNNGRGFEIPDELTRNILYEFDTGNGQVTSRGSTNANAHRTFPGTVPYNTSDGPASVDREWGIVDTGFIFPTGGDGGDIQGIAYDPDNFGILFAATDQGGIHSFSFSDNIAAPPGPAFGYANVIPTTFHGVVPIDPEHALSSFSSVPQFSGLTFGPRTIEDGELRQTLFMTTSDGWLYAAEVDLNGKIQPANVFYGGRYAVELTFAGDTFGFNSLPATGLAFSPLEENPWHQTGDRFNDPGHGIQETFDRSREDLAIGGGSSLYFGFEINNTVTQNTLSRADDSPLSELAPGGSHGSVVSRPFNLDGYSAADKPTLYFSYFMEVEANDDYFPTGANARNQNDSFRVFGAGDDGEWILLGTNNDFRELAFPDEYDYFNETNVPVQELFDDSGNWRQARVDLSPLAGSERARIRFDFSTSGSMRSHFGSIDLVAVDGDEVVDHQQVVFDDEDNNQVVLENIVGQDLLFPAGIHLSNGDQFSVLTDDGVATLTFIDTPPPGPGFVQFSTSMTKAQVGAAVVAAMPQFAGAVNNGGGRVSFLAASDVAVSGTAPIGRSNPVLVQRLADNSGFVFGQSALGARQLSIPDGTSIQPGDQIRLRSQFGAGAIDETFTFVIVSTGAPGEIVFDASESADVIAERLVKLISPQVQAVNEGNGLITLLNSDVTITTIPAASQIGVNDPFAIDESRVRIVPADGDNLVNGETLTFKHRFGTTTVTFQDSPLPSVPGIVRFQGGDTVATIAQRLLSVLPLEVSAYDAGGNAISVAATVTSNVPGTELGVGPAPAKRITIPDGNLLFNTETLTISDDNGLVELEFIQSSIPGPPGTVNYLQSETADVIASRVASVLGPNYDLVVNGADILIYGAVGAEVSPFSNIATVSELAQEVIVPDPSLLIDGQTIDVVTGTGTTTITFVFAASAANPGEVFYTNTDTANDVAVRLAAELAAQDAVVDTVFGTGVRFLANSVVDNTASTASTLTNQSLLNNFILNLDIPDGNQLRNGSTIQLFGPTFETITFIRQGQTVTNSPTIPVFYNTTDTALDLIPQILTALSAQWDAYLDPLGHGIHILNPTAFAFLDATPPAILETGREVNESAIPLTLPSGNLISDGLDTLTITAKEDVTGAGATTFRFVTPATSTGLGNEIVYNASDTAAEVTLAVLSQLPQSYQAFLSGPNQLQLLNAQSLSVRANSLIVSYQATNAAEMPIIIDNSMSSREVAERLQIGLVEGFGRFQVSDIDLTESDVYKVYGGDRIRLYNATPRNQGPFGISGYDIASGAGLTTTPLPGDEFGENQPGFIGTSQIRQQGALNNEVQGVYIDDIIVGFAERGEMVINATTDQTSFIFNPETLPDTHPAAIQPERQNETLLGPYSLEIRTGDSYGVEQDYFPINLELGEQSALGRSFDTNDRLADGAVTLITPAGTDLLDGDTFVLSDGWRTKTFEFDSSLDGNHAPGNVPVVFNPASPDPALVARAVRDAINSSQAQNVLEITAATSDGFESAANTGNRVELFGSNIVINPSGGRFIKMDLVNAETSQGRETSRQIPIVFQDEEAVFAGIFADELSRSTPTGYFDGSVDTLVGIGKIGDYVNTGTGISNLQDGAVVLASDPSKDFDSVRIYLQAGQSVDIDVDTQGFSKAGEILDLPVITVFDAGDVLTEDLFGFTLDRARQSSLFEASRANGENEDGAFLQFMAPQDGYYDVVVSSASLFGNSFMEIPSFASAAFFDGTTFNLQAGPSQVTYEYTTNPALVTVNTVILLNAGDGPDEIAQATADAIAANQSDVLRPLVDGRFINLQDNGDLPFITFPGFFGFNNLGYRDIDFGEYALTVRPTAASGNVPARDVLMVDYQFGITDVNRVKDQGQLIISSNFIRNSANAGVLAVPGSRGDTLTNNTFVPSGAIFTPGSGDLSPDGLPRPGSARLLRNQNTQDLIPGVVISNNVVSGSGSVGIDFGGDVNVNGQIESPASFGRIVNNTVVNTGSGEGIRISGNSSPTVLNNIITGFQTGLSVAGNQVGEIVVGGNAYRRNNTDSTIGISPSSFIVPDTVLLFQNQALGVYIPAAGSDVIDSSFDSLDEREEYFDTVKEPAGIERSPIIAPEFDAYGQPRVDDPAVQTPGGVGDNVFIDRGAIDRADFAVPTAALTTPQDSIGFQIDGGDRDVDESFVRLIEGTVEFFEVQLYDPAGTGIDPLTVNTETVILTEDGIRLIPDQDYVFGYSGNSRTIRLTPLTGIWRPDAVYEITLNNDERIEITLPSGDQIADGNQVVITDDLGVQSVFEFDSGFSLVVPQTTKLKVTETSALFNDGDLLTITSPTGVVRNLEFDTNGSVTNGNIRVDLTSTGTIQGVRNAILAALASTDPGSASTVQAVLDLVPVAIGGDEIQLGTLAGHTVTTNAAAITFSGQAGGVVDGDGFTYTSGTESVTFELTTDLGVSDPSFLPITFTRADTPDQIAAAIAVAVGQQSLGLTEAQGVGGGRVVLGGLEVDTLIVNGSGLTLAGAPGVTPGAIPVEFLPSPQVSPAVIASALQTSIRQSGLTIAAFNPGGGTLLINNATLVQGDFSGLLTSIGDVVPAIADLAGNSVRQTRVTNETRFTIIMPEVVFDYGDAPPSYQTVLADNGARHTYSGTSTLRLGEHLDTENDGQPINQDDTPLSLSATVTGVVFDVRPVASNAISVTVLPAPPVGGETVQLTIGGTTKTFQLIQSTANPTSGNIPVTFTSGEPSSSIAKKLSDAIRANFDVVDEAVLQSFDATGTILTLTAVDDEDGVPVRVFNDGTNSYRVFVQPGTPEGQVITRSDVVGFLNPLDPAGTSIPIHVTGSGLLDIWVDFDQNGRFDEDEQVARNVPVVDGDRNVTVISDPTADPGDTWMRVRLSSSGNLLPGGVAVGGEVEDYLVSVIPLALPTPNPDVYTTREDTTLVVNSVSAQNDLLFNDANVNGQLLDTRFFVGQQPSNGTLIVTDEVEGYFTYIPNTDFYGVDTFTYRLSTQANSGSSAALATFATVTINVEPVNDAPGFVPGSLPRSFVGLERNVLQPDSLEIDPADLLVGSVGHANPAIPSAPWDESDQTPLLRVISVTAGGLTISKANEFDVATTANGVLSAEFAIDGTITKVIYTPNLDFNSDNPQNPDGSPLLDGFTYTIQDNGLLAPVGAGSPTVGTPLTAIGNAEIRVTPQNNPPTPVTEVLSIDDPAYTAFFAGQNLPVPTEDEQLLIPAAFLLQNDFAGSPLANDENTFVGNNDAPLRIVGATIDPSQGQIQLLPTGDLLLTPADDIYGTIEFSYTVEDTGVNEAVDGTRVVSPLTSTVTTTVILEPVNDAPVAYDRSLSVVEAVEPAGPAVLSFTAADLLQGRGINANSPIVVTSSQITVPDGATMIDGETIILTDSTGLRRVIEFNTSGMASIGTDLLVSYTLSDTADTIATQLENVLRADGAGGVANGNIVSLIGVTNITSSTFNSTISANSNLVSIPDGATLVSGETITFTDANNVNLVVEFNTTGVSRGGADVVIGYSVADSSQTIADQLRNALVAQGFGAVSQAGVGTRWDVRLGQLTVASINDGSSMIGVSGAQLTLPDGGNIINGETITLNNGFGGQVVVEFNTTGTPSAGSDLVVVYTQNDLAPQIASSMQALLRAQGYGLIAAGNAVTLTDVTAAVAAAPTTAVVTTPTTIVLPNGNEMVDGETVDLVTPAGTRVIEFNTSGVLSIGSDYVIPFTALDTADTLATLVQNALRVDGYAVAANGAVVTFSNPASIAVSELQAVAGDFDDDLPVPFNETEQSLRVVSFSTSEGTVDVALAGNGVHTLGTSIGGTLTLTFNNGLFVNGLYTPPQDYNEQLPFVANDLFTYTIADDGRTTQPVGGVVEDLADERSLIPATVTITVTATNDPPTFTSPTEIDVLEDSAGTTVPNIVSNALPGPATALDELASQTVTFSVVPVSVPTGLMSQDPVITAGLGLTVYPSADQVGTAVYILRATDDDPNNAGVTDALITINVRPVNDAPRFDPTVAGTSVQANPDAGYSVANVRDVNNNVIDASITYRLREDNTQPLGATAPYRIELSRDPNAVGFNPVGLLDVFTVGPANEADSTPGGMQSLELFAFPATTTLGGQLFSVFENGQLVALNYVPPLNYNSTIGGVDSFTYTVRDGSVAGETYSINAGALVPDRLTSDNTVFLDLTPVNDRPQFNLATNQLEVSEDGAEVSISNYAFNINPGPPATAFDEVDIVAGQTVRFSVTSLGFPISESSQYFTKFPTITPQGQLSYQPAPDVFGRFTFEVVLTDDGPGNATRGDLISSIPATITIDVRPVNDPPVVDPTADPLHFSLLEDGTFDILVNGDSVSPGLLDVFLPGPANESSNVDPGGNQSVSLTTPIPVATAAGGTLEAISDATGLTRLRYRPRPNYTGPDSFIYTVTDDGVTVGIGAGGIASNDPRIASNTVTFDVVAVNDSPQFSGASNVVSQEDAGVVTVSGWATNVQPGPTSALDEVGQNLSFEIVQVSSNPELFLTPPTAVINGTSATLTYQAAPNANGVAVLTVKLVDDGPTNLPQGDDNESELRTFTIRVNPVNDAPSFTPGSIVTIDEDSGPYADIWARNISPGPADESTQSVRFEVTTPVDAQPLFQTLPEISDTGVLRFIPAANANGTVDLQVVAIDSGGARTNGTVLRLVINAVNDIPRAVADPSPGASGFSTTEDSVLVIPSSALLANDIDPDLPPAGTDVLRVVMPAEGFSVSGARVTFDSVTGLITYDPTVSSTAQALSPSQILSDTFRYSVVDASGSASPEVSVTLNVTGVNDAPTVRGDNPTLSLSGPTVINVLDNDFDIDNAIDPSSIQISFQPAFGSLDISPQGVITFTPFQAFDEVDQFGYTVRDELGLVSQTAIVTIAANAAPISFDDRALVFIDEPTDIAVLVNDSDPDGALDPQGIQIISQPLHGQAIARGDGTIRYIPGTGFVGNDSFQYAVADLEGRLGNVATVDVQVVLSRLQNPDLIYDVNDDGNVTAIDALLIINRLAAASREAGQSVRSIPVEDTDFGPPYFDVNGNQFITSGDALAVIDELGRRRADNIEGELIVGAGLGTPLQKGSETSIETISSDVAVDLIEPAAAKLVEVSNPASSDADVIDLLAADQDETEERSERIEALDAAFMDLI